MPQRVELARPVLRATRCLHPHHAAWQPAHEPQHLRAPQLPADYHPPAAIRTANREHTLSQVDPDRCNFHLGPRAFRMLLTHPRSIARPFISGGVDSISLRFEAFSPG